MFLLFFSSVSSAETWQLSEDPSQLSSAYIYKLDELPLKGSLKTIPWSDSYWPDQKGSITYRWNQKSPLSFGFNPPTRGEVKRMARADLLKLSPAEKYDLFMGRYDYPLFSEVRANPNVFPRAVEWAGICDGWSMASLQFKEPKPQDQLNPDGIVIPFSSSDIKAVLDYAMAYHFSPEFLQAGDNCKGSVCAGLNAGAFHVILTNQIAIQNHAFIMDRSATNEIWNQPVYAYDLEILGSITPDTGSRGVRIKGEVTYTDELSAPEVNPVLGTPKQKVSKMFVYYALDLDQEGRIIGGRYLRKSSRPDSAWFPYGNFEFTGYYSGLSKLLP